MGSMGRRDKMVDAFRRAGSVVPTGQVERLLKTGRSAVGMAGVMQGERWGGGGSERTLDAVASLVTQLGELKGVAMKAGQMLSFLDPTLPEEARNLLALLQMQAPATPLEQVQATLTTELGIGAAELLRTLDPVPVAVASIGQVHKAKLADGTLVAVKVQHAGVREALLADFRTASSAGSVASLLVPQANMPGFVAEAREVFVRECDFAWEARQQQRYGELFGAKGPVRIPTVEARLCSPRVLTTHWLPGPPLHQALASNPSQQLRNDWGLALFQAYVGTLYAHGLFHADPHPGNYAFLQDGSIILYDFGCVREFDRAAVLHFSDLADATRRADEDGVFAALKALGAGGADTVDNRRLALTLLQRFWGPMLKPGARAIPSDGAMEAQRMMQDKRSMARLGIPPAMLFLLRIRFGLYAVLARLSSVLDWSALEQTWAREARGGAKARN